MSIINSWVAIDRWEDLEEVGGGETIIKTMYKKEIYFQLKKNKNSKASAV